MNVRGTRRMLWGLTAAFCAAAVGVWALAMFVPYAAPGADGPPRVVPVRSGQEPVPPLDLDAARPLWSLPLQQPLYDPAPEAEARQEASRPPRLRVRLLGTVIESDDAQAIFMTSADEIVFKRVGDVVEDAAVRQILDTQVEVLYHDETQTLTLDTD